MSTTSLIEHEAAAPPHARGALLAPVARTRPDAPAALVIALHASAGSGRQWRALGEALAPACDLVAVDLLGHGAGSSVVPGRPKPLTAPTAGGSERSEHAGPAWPGLRPLRLLDDALRVVPIAAAAHAAGRDVHLVGHSYGGAVALKVASLAPGALRSVALYEPVVFRVLLDDEASRDEARDVIAVPAAMRTHLERGDDAEAARVFIDFWSGSGTWAALPEHAKPSIAARMPVVLQHFGALVAERRQVAALEALALPVLVLSGELTVKPARRIAERLRGLLPAASHATLPGLGHMGPVTHAAEVNARLCAFLGSQRDTAPSTRSMARDAALAPA